MKKKVLVTGANGQLGLTFQERFENNSDTCEFTFYNKSELDISKPENIKRVLESDQFDYCINCAAYTNVEQAEKTPQLAYAINAESVKILAEHCEKYQITLIQISTDYVFDGTKKQPYTVEDETNPINEYGKSKLLGEQYIRNVLKNYYIVRTSWLFSKKYGKNFYRTIVSKIGQTDKIGITDEQMGCPTNCENLANFIHDYIIKTAPKYGTFHYCDEAQMTWYDFAKLILEENNALDKVNLRIDKKYVTFAKRPLYSVLKPTI